MRIHAGSLPGTQSYTLEDQAPVGWSAINANHGDGMNHVIRGDEILLRQAQHPVDRNPTDWQMEITEVTAYGSAWRTESTWPAGPNPNPIDYVTSAAWLWRNGEQYQIGSLLNGPCLKTARLGGVSAGCRIHH